MIPVQQRHTQTFGDYPGMMLTIAPKGLVLVPFNLMVEVSIAVTLQQQTRWNAPDVSPLGGYGELRNQFEKYLKELFDHKTIAPISPTFTLSGLEQIRAASHVFPHAGIEDADRKLQALLEMHKANVIDLVLFAQGDDVIHRQALNLSSEQKFVIDNCLAKHIMMRNAVLAFNSVGRNQLSDALFKAMSVMADMVNALTPSVMFTLSEVKLNFG